MLEPDYAFSELEKMANDIRYSMLDMYYVVKDYDCICNREDLKFLAINRVKYDDFWAAGIFIKSLDDSDAEYFSFLPYHEFYEILEPVDTKEKFFSECEKYFEKYLSRR